MKHSITKAAAVAALAAGALLAVPTAASAAPGDGYTPPAQGQVSDSTVAPGAAITFSVTDDAFVPGETVSISITGENASGASMGFVKFAVETRALGTTTANADGGVSGVRINLPANASGSYTILATSPSNPVGVSATVTVAAAGGGSTDGSNDDALATTGPDSAAMLGLWVGGGALVLAGGAVAVASAVRRNRNETSEA